MLLDAFIKIEEPKLEGESTDADHTGEIEVLSFSQQITRSSLLGAAGENARRAQSEHTPVTVIKPLDKASPKLYQAACAGTIYKKVTLSLCQPGGSSSDATSKWKKVVYWEMTLENVHISRIHYVADPSLHLFGDSEGRTFPLLNGEATQMGPLEEFDLKFEKIKWLYKGGTGQQKISGSWNLLANANAA